MSFYLQYRIKTKLNKIASDVKSNNTTTLSNLLQEVIKSSRGHIEDKEDVLQSLINLIHIKNVNIKKLVYLYVGMLMKYDKSIYLRISNHVGNDASDPNPAIRMCAYRLLLDSYNLHELHSQELPTILKGLGDNHPNIKSLILTKISNLSLQTEEQKKEAQSAVVKLLKEEPDSLVVIRCINCLTCMHDVIDFSMLLNLLYQIKPMQIKAKYYLIMAIIETVNINKISHEESFQILNILESYISNPYKPYLSMICLKLMLLVSSKFDKVCFDVKVRAVNHILKLLEITDDKNEIFLLSNLCALLNSTDKLRPLLTSAWKTFLVLPSDLPLCCVYKMKILSNLINENNYLVLHHQSCKVILKNYSEEATRISLNIILQLHPFQPEKCINTLHSFLRHNNTTVLNYTVQILLQLSYKFDNVDVQNLWDDANCFKALIEKLNSRKSRVAFLILLLNFDVSDISLANSIANGLVDLHTHWDCINCEVLMPLLLTVILKFFLQFPHVFQKNLNNLMQLSLKHQNYVISNKSKFYFYLLKSGIENAKTLIFSSHMNIATEKQLVCNWDENIPNISDDNEILNYY